MDRYAEGNRDAKERFVGRISRAVCDSHVSLDAHAEHLGKLLYGEFAVESSLPQVLSEDFERTLRFSYMMARLIFLFGNTLGCGNVNGQCLSLHQSRFAKSSLYYNASRHIVNLSTV